MVFPSALFASVPVRPVRAVRGHVVTTGKGRSRGRTRSAAEGEHRTGEHRTPWREERSGTVGVLGQGSREWMHCERQGGDTKARRAPSAPTRAQRGSTWPQGGLREPTVGRVGLKPRKGVRLALWPGSTRSAMARPVGAAGGARPMGSRDQKISAEIGIRAASRHSANPGPYLLYLVRRR